MRLRELHEEDLLGIPTPTIKDIAKKHGVSLKKIKQQLIKGEEIELEHTKDRSVANEIARDHLAELPNYYDQLEKVENNKK